MEEQNPQENTPFISSPFGLRNKMSVTNTKNCWHSNPQSQPLHSLFRGLQTTL